MILDCSIKVAPDLCTYSQWQMQDENQGEAKTMKMLICMKI
jgi:hypothetical protein